MHGSKPLVQQFGRLVDAPIEGTQLGDKTRTGDVWDIVQAAEAFGINGTPLDGVFDNNTPPSGLICVFGNITPPSG